MAVYLYHGNNAFKVFKTYLKLKNKLVSSGSVPVIIEVNKDTKFYEYEKYFLSGDLFNVDKYQLVLKEVLDKKSIPQFYKDMMDYSKNFVYKENLDIHIFNSSAVPKNTIIYKFVSKHGKVYEFRDYSVKQKADYILNSMYLKTASLAELIVKKANGDMFAIESSIKLLKSYSQFTGQPINEDIIHLLCFEFFSQDASWNLGKLLLKIAFDAHNDKSSLLSQYWEDLDKLEQNNLSYMMILYSFYYYVLNLIKLKKLQSQGKSFRKCMKVGYFFVKDFYEFAKTVSIEKVFALNTFLLETESKIKTGLFTERQAFIQISLYLSTGSSSEVQ